MTREDLKKNIPNSPGVYLFSDQTGGILYVGKSVNLKNRILSYFSLNLGQKTARLVSEAEKLDYIKVTSDLAALLLEAKLIRIHKPKYNSISKDDKSPLYIAVTKGEFPKILSMRETDLKSKTISVSADFGPFPSAKTAHIILKKIRRIFPFCTQKSNNRVCFYSHIGLCNPCPSFILKTKGQKRKLLTKVYKININFLKRVLSGKSDAVKKSLLAEMNVAVKSELFEEAAKLRDQLRKLEYITTSFENVDNYLTNPNLIDDVREAEIFDLFDVLKTKIDLKNIPTHIECYDCSHLSGSLPTASMVTFIDGEKHSNLYRHFKIMVKKGGDDLAYLSEIFKRRFQNKKLLLPDLIVVDGGKGQVGASRAVLKNFKKTIPIIGLSKGEEQIIAPKFPFGFEVLKLDKGRPALILLRRIRDEAHRFARAYHFKLRMGVLFS